MRVALEGRNWRLPLGPTLEFDDIVMEAIVEPQQASVIAFTGKVGRATIKGSARRTRTEAFLEWVQEHPEDVLRHQENAADREVAALVAEHHATAARLRKGKRHYAELAEAVPF
jgi:hypothetical protein